MPRIAVIIPTYNRRALLKSALDSVFSQTCKDFEAIVVDDGSQDRTSELVRQYKQCRYIKLEHSGLPAVARNDAIRKTDAEFIAFLDSDDEWFPHKLERQMSILAEANAGLVCSNAFLLLEGQKDSMRPYLSPGQGKTGRVLEDLIRDNFVITSSVIVRRDLVNRMGGFSEEPALRALEDYDLWLRVAAVSEIHYVPEELVLYRHSPTSISRSHTPLSRLRSMSLIFKRASEVPGARDPGVKAAIQEQLHVYRRAICDIHLAERHFMDFAKALSGFCGSSPLGAGKYLVGVLSRRLNRFDGQK